MKKAVIYIHGLGGSAAEAAHFIPLFPDAEVIGFDYHAEVPWEANREFSAYFDKVGQTHDEILLVANSIGAFFTMHARVTDRIRGAYFISPLADMEKFITDRMARFGVSEETLCAKREIVIPTGERLSWAYLSYVREHPVDWRVPTHILYGENDALIPFETVAALAASLGATLDVMPGGGHWFHTGAQMSYLDAWIEREQRIVSVKQ